MLDFIYTFSEYCKNNYANTMLLYIKSIGQLTIFCSNDISEKIINKFMEFQEDYSCDDIKENAKEEVLDLLYNNRDKVKIK